MAQYLALGTVDGLLDSIYLLLRIIFIASSAQMYRHIVYQMIFTITPAIFLGIRPYKKQRYNYFDTYLLLVFAIGISWYNYREVSKNIGWIFVVIIVIGILVLYIVVFISWMISALTSRCGFSCCRQGRATHQTGSSTDNEALPHRISDQANTHRCYHQQPDYTIEEYTKKTLCLLCMITNTHAFRVSISTTCMHALQEHNYTLYLYPYNNVHVQCLSELRNHLGVVWWVG